MQSDLTKFEMKVLPKLLRVLSGISVFGASYGLWAILIDCVLRQTGNTWLFTTCSVLLGLCAMGLTALLSKSKLPLWLQDVLRYVFAVIGAGGMFAAVYLWRELSLGAGVFAAGMGFVLVLLGGLCAKYKPNVMWLMGTGGVLLACAAIVKLALGEASPSMGGFAWVFFFGAAFLTAGANYASIDRHMSRRGHSKARLPERVRRNNLLLILGLFGVGALFLVLRKFFGGLLTAVIRGIVTAALWVVDAILSLLPERSATGASAATPPPMTGGAAEEASKLGDLLYWIVGGLAFTAILIFGAKPAWQWLKGKLLKLTGAVRRWLNRAGGDGTRRVTDTDYVDIVERIDEAHLETREDTGSAGLRRWRRDVRRLSRMKPGRERFVQSYRLLLRGSALHGAELTVADTPQEAGEKLQALVSDTDVAAITRQAEAVAFSGREANTDSTGVEAALEVLK